MVERRSPRREATRQLMLFALAYLVYLAGRWLTGGDRSAALAHAHAHTVLDLERALGLTVERRVQYAVDAPAIELAMSYLYLAAQLLVVPAALVWTYRMSRRVYVRLRDTVLATWLFAIPVYALFPVAPPRLATGGTNDTVSHVAGVGLTGRSTLFYNQFAAIPSLHVGFAFAVGVAGAAVASSWHARALALLWGPIVVLVVVGTGNHYILDAGAGVIVTGLGCCAAILARRLVTTCRRATPPRDPSGRARCAT